MTQQQVPTHPFQSREFRPLDRAEADKPPNTTASLCREMHRLLSRHGEPMHRFDIFRAMQAIGFPAAAPHPLHNFNQHLREDPNLVPTGNGHWTTQEFLQLQETTENPLLAINPFLEDEEIERSQNPR